MSEFKVSIVGIETDFFFCFVVAFRDFLMLDKFGSSPSTTLFLLIRSLSIAASMEAFLFVAALVILTQFSFSSAMVDWIQERGIEIEIRWMRMEVRRVRKREEAKRHFCDFLE